MPPVSYVGTKHTRNLRLSQLLPARHERRAATYIPCHLQRGIPGRERLFYPFAGATVHRDLKPENIYIVPDAEMPGGERIKLLDFGIAKIFADAGKVRTQANVIMGTPAYMSPEQCLGAKDVDAKTDVYALGIILFEMLAGRPPFVAERPGEYLPMHMLKPPPLLTQFVPLVPSKLVGLVHSMLAKEPTARPTMEQVAAQLQRLVQGQGQGQGSQASQDLQPIQPPSAEERPTRPAKALGKGRVSAEISDADLPVTAALRVKKLAPADKEQSGQHLKRQTDRDSGAYDPTSPGAPNFSEQLAEVLDNARTIPVQSVRLSDMAGAIAAPSSGAPTPEAPSSGVQLPTGPSWVPMEIVRADKSGPPEPSPSADKPAPAKRPSPEALRVPPTAKAPARPRIMLGLLLAAALLLVTLTALLLLRGGS